MQFHILAQLFAPVNWRTDLSVTQKKVAKGDESDNATSKV
jgi:hypothetical protein